MNINFTIQKIEKEKFPSKLLNIPNTPNQLYAVGNTSLLYKDSFAIVGTRHITDYGKNNCQKIVKEFALREIPIVSGMAIGTDAVAHQTVLEYDGKTIAVLGSGFNHIFPKENLELFNQIVDNGGLVLTEFEADEKPQSKNFPVRNRIVSALSEGVLVIEAGYRSGTSITVKHAKKQGKKVFALPGRLDNYYGTGVNRMIKEGAIFTTEIKDVLQYYPQFVKKKRKNIHKKRIDCGKTLPKIKEEYRKIVQELKNCPMLLEEIMYQTGLEVKNAMNLLMNMEIDGIIEKDFSGKYKIKK